MFRRFSLKSIDQQLAEQGFHWRGLVHISSDAKKLSDAIQDYDASKIGEEITRLHRDLGPFNEYYITIGEHIPTDSHERACETCGGGYDIKIYVRD